jgi:hypothetical protein
MKELYFKPNLFISSYRGALSSLVAPASTAPFFVISGATDKVIALKRIRISGATLTAVAYLNLALAKYSTAPTGGTASTITAVSYKSNQTASSASLIQGYTAAPTAGTLVGDIATERILGQATTATSSSYLYDYEFVFDDDSLPFSLTSAAETFGLRFTTAPASAVTLSIHIEWEEYNTKS